MIFSGKNYRSLLEKDTISFEADLSIDNLKGAASFGFSGEGKSISFSFESGRIYDPENRYFSSYEANSAIALSGNISGVSYDYYYNSSPICFIGKKDGFKVRNFFVNTTGCNLDVKSIVVNSTQYDYALNFATGFVSGKTITGLLKSVETGTKFEIFSGEIVSPTSFIFSGFESGRVNSSVITITPSGVINLYDLFSINLNLYTNFGKINKKFEAKSLPEGGYLVALINETTNNSERYPFIGGDVTGTKTNNYELTYNVSDRFVLLTTPQPISVSFQYFAGNTGDYYRVTGINVTNSGSGYSQSPAIIFNVPMGVRESIKASGSGVLVGSGLSSIVILNSGLYLSGLPTVSISGISGAGSGALASVSGDYFYTKSFTGNWNIETGVNSGGLIDFRASGYTGLDSNNNLRYLGQTNVVPTGVVMTTRLSYANTFDPDPLTSRLDFSGINGVSIFELFDGVR